MKKKIFKILSFLINIFFIAGAFFIIKYSWNLYLMNNFGDFKKAEGESGITEFTRELENNYSEMYSYKIKSNEFNDALIYKEISVDKDTRYKVTAMVKYENVVNEKNEENGGVNICLLDTTEKSNSYVGSSDWKKITFEFNSKNRDKIKLAFRLGSYDENSKGQVCFSDYTIEKSMNNIDSNWNCALFIMKNLNVNIKNENRPVYTKLSLEKNDIKLLSNNMERFKNSMSTLSR